MYPRHSQSYYNEGMTLLTKGYRQNASSSQYTFKHGLPCT